MCGVLGVVGPASVFVDVKKSLGSLTHRGRDHHSLSTGPGYAIGYCRLAIRGVGQSNVTGHQPFKARGDRWLCYGVGEVYNSDRLRAGAQDEVLPPEGDIGGLLSAYLERGPEGFTAVTGEFACALYDKQEQQLVLGRDHLGTRGLYYSEIEGSLYFASEVKALASMGVHLQPDPTTTAAYLRFNYPLAPSTWYEGIKAVPAGSTLQWRAGRSHVEPYADIGALATEVVEAQYAVSREELRELLTSSVRARTLSDVGLGYHLSGGLDSSLVAQLGGAKSGTAFTVDYEHSAGFGKSDCDAYWARQVAHHLDLNWRFIPATTEYALGAIPQVLAALDGPLMSPGAVTPYLVAQAAARNGTKVLLEGQGADEVFLGYRRFEDAWRLPHADITELAANVNLADIALVAPRLLPKVAEADISMRRAAGPFAIASPVLGLQIAYLRHFLHELLRIEDHVHLAWTVENRPPLLDRTIVRAGLSISSNSPEKALGKPFLRQILLDERSPAAQRAGKQQMTVSPVAAASWSSHILTSKGALKLMGSFDHHGIAKLVEMPTTLSRQRLLWALANLVLWSRATGFEV